MLQVVGFLCIELSNKRLGVLPVNKCVHLLLYTAHTKPSLVFVIPLHSLKVVGRQPLFGADCS